MDWKKLMTTGLILWFVAIPTPSGLVTVGRSFKNEADCLSALAVVTTGVNSGQTQRELNSLSNFHVNPKGLASLGAQATCVER